MARPDAQALMLADERVSRALADENGYWRSAEVRLQALRQRCQDAGHDTPDTLEISLMT